MPIARELSDRGFDVHLVSAPGERTLGPQEEKVTWHPLEMRRGPSIFSDLRSFWSWLRLIRRVSPEIVSLGTPKAAFLGLMAAKFLSVPHRVYQLRGLRLETAQGALRFFSLLSERISVACSTQIIAVSESLRSRYLALGLSSPSEIQVIGCGSSHGVNTNRFKSVSRIERSVLKSQMGIDMDLPVLGFVGRFSRDKGSDSLVAVRQLLHKNGVDHEFIFIGTVEGDVKNLLKLSDCGRPMRNLGFLHDTERYYPLMTVLLLPSKREGFPNVVLEAASCKVPTIASDATGCVDAIIHGETGHLVESKNPRDFAQEVLETISDLRRIEKMGKAAQQRAHSLYKQDTVVGIQSDWYVQLAN